MTPQPPSSSEGSPLPPRHRPNLGSLGKDTTESDLWDFDDELPQAAPPIHTVPREHSPKPAAAKEAATPKPEKRTRPEEKSPQTAAGPLSKRKASPDPAFEDLESWDDNPVDTRPILKLTPEEPKAPPPPPKPRAAKAVKPATAEVPETPPAAQEQDEFSPAVRPDATPAALPKLGLSRLERIGLGVVLLLLIGGGILFAVNSLSRLPGGSQQVEAGDFPIKGTRLTMDSAESFWREPIREGPDADSFRRGTSLLPALDLPTEGGPAAVRIFFRNSEGELVGDPVTRAVPAAATKIKVAATAGFDDVILHAAYRAGEGKPWTIEVHEGPSVDAPGQDFKKLFEMAVSTARR